MADHIEEARRLTELAGADRGDMGRIERAMYLTEANNHLLWHLVENS
jgi:hypothetical protein